MIPQISANNLIPGVVPTGAAPVQAANLVRTSGNAGNTGASTFAPPAFDAQNGGVPAAIQATLEMVAILLSQLKGNKANMDIGSAPQPTATSGNTGNAGGPSGTTLSNQTSDAQQSDRLDNTLSKIAQDPEGSKLLAAAKAKGYTIEVGDPSAAAGGSLDKENAITCPHCRAAMDAGQQVNGVTLPDQKKIVINPNAPEFDKTVVHELVHAATDGDNNSQQEEGIADVIGYRVSNRMNGNASNAGGLGGGDPESIYRNKMANYQDLNQSNDVRNTLAALGIDAGV